MANETNQILVTEDIELDKTIMSWKDLLQENELLKNKLEAEQKEKELESLGIERIRKATGTEKKTNVPLLNMILRGDFVALYGARTSGKSTRVIQVMEKLKSLGIVCIYVTFEQCDMKTINTFWSTFGTALRISAPKYFGKDDVKSASDFLIKFEKEKWNDIHVVLFIDEYDTLFEAHDDIKYSFLKTIRGIRNIENYYSLLSLVAIGPFSILHLSSDRIITSPFNIREPFRNPNFTLEQVQTVYKEFENDFYITIDPRIIEDIYIRTSGHAALVCLCGKVISSYLMTKLDENRRLDFSIWTKFVVNSMHNIIFDYITFRKMITTLLKKEIRPAVKLLRSVFLGSSGFISIYDSEEKKLAEFLTAEGVLIRNEMMNNFKMSSMFVDELIQRYVIPILYSSAPTNAVPKKPDDSLDIINILKIAIQFFDKEIIYKAFNRSFKTAHVYVKGQKNILVPQESMYNLELSRILVNWIVKQTGFEVTGQWHQIEYHANKNNKYIYSNMIIKTPKQTIILKILATATKKELDEHFVKVLDYAKKLSANEIWIVHFTCEDYTTPYWPSDKKFEKINIAHFFHDQIFKNVQMKVQFVSDSGTIDYINDDISL
ncbi:hypothetical protein C1645_730990 [Glomus cerebriforme]|uniref:P-loop containing nucleoside triphosphate hydrolase protein n=1 Tax=Glomus cerebriforme TaxID=658196 RepID=A0A397TPL7_9GLOM|nr:hypothetical protein C1645_730990 [Glomus cerebriforme]